MMAYALTTVPELGKTRPENGVKELIICPFSSLLDRKRFESFLFAEAIPDYFFFRFYFCRSYFWLEISCDGNNETSEHKRGKQTDEQMNFFDTELPGK